MTFDRQVGLCEEPTCLACGDALSLPRSSASAVRCGSCDAAHFVIPHEAGLFTVVAVNDLEYGALDAMPDDAGVRDRLRDLGILTTPE